MTHRDVFVVSTARTAIGTFGGSPENAQHPARHHRRQSRHPARWHRARRRGPCGDGQRIPTDTKDAYLSRVAAIDMRLPHRDACLQRQPPVGSGLQAIISAAQAIGYGDCDVAVGGGSDP